MKEKKESTYLYWCYTWPCPYLTESETKNPANSDGSTKKHEGEGCLAF